MRVTPEDYGPLKAFFVWFWEHAMPVPASLSAEDRPPAVLERFEARSRATAGKGLGMAIGDIVELTEGYSAEQVRAYDAALAAEGLITLSEVRARFGRTVRAIMKRGAVRSEAEYNALRNVVDSMPEGERTEAWRLLGAYETRIG